MGLRSSHCAEATSCHVSPHRGLSTRQHFHTTEVLAHARQNSPIHQARLYSQVSTSVAGTGKRRFILKVTCSLLSATLTVLSCLLELCKVTEKLLLKLQEMVEQCFNELKANMNDGLTTSCCLLLMNHPLYAVYRRFLEICRAHRLIMSLPNLTFTYPKSLGTVE